MTIVVLTHDNETVIEVSISTLSQVILDAVDCLDGEELSDMKEALQSGKSYRVDWCLYLPMNKDNTWVIGENYENTYHTPPKIEADRLHMSEPDKKHILTLIGKASKKTG